jgi:hypothetical protein
VGPDRARPAHAVGGRGRSSDLIYLVFLTENPDQPDILCPVSDDENDDQPDNLDDQPDTFDDQPDNLSTTNRTSCVRGGSREGVDRGEQKEGERASRALFPLFPFPTGIVQGTRATTAAG